MPWPARYSQMAWVVARMWASLNEPCEARAAVAGRAEGDLLARVGRIRVDGEVGRHEVGHVDEVGGLPPAARRVGRS